MADTARTTPTAEVHPIPTGSVPGEGSPVLAVGASYLDQGPSMADAVHSDDTDLADLIADYDRKRAEYVAADEASTAPRMAYLAAEPPMPPALIWRSGDTFRHPTGRQQIEGSASWYAFYSMADIDGLRTMRDLIKVRWEGKPAPWNPEEQVGRYVPYPDVRAIARRDELISTSDVWESEKDKVREATGLAAANDRAEAATAAMNDAEDAVLDYVPRTFAGLQAKALWVQRTNLCADAVLIILRDLCQMPAGSAVASGWPIDASSTQHNRFAAYHAEMLALIAAHNAAKTDEEAAPLSARGQEIDATILRSCPVTLAEAASALEYARREYVQHTLEDDERGGDDGERLVVHVFDSVVGLLRRYLDRGVIAPGTAWAPARLDPIIAMHRKASELYACHGNDDTPGDKAEAALDQVNALVLAAPSVPPSTPAGALAALAWGRDELLRMMEQHKADTPWDKAIVSMLDSALAVFHAAVISLKRKPEGAVHPAEERAA